MNINNIPADPAEALQELLPTLTDKVLKGDVKIRTLVKLVDNEDRQFEVNRYAVFIDVKDYKNISLDKCYRIHELEGDIKLEINGTTNLNWFVPSNLLVLKREEVEMFEKG